MIRNVRAYKSGKQNKTHYKVLYNRKEMTYTNDDVPTTVIKFMETHNYIKVDGKMIFE